MTTILFVQKKRELVLIKDTIETIIYNANRG